MGVSHPRTSCKINPANDLPKVACFQPFPSILSLWLNLTSLIFIEDCSELLIHHCLPDCLYIYKQDLRLPFISIREIPLVTLWNRIDLSKTGDLEKDRSRRSSCWLISLVSCVRQL